MAKQQTAVERAFAALTAKYGTTSLEGSKAQVVSVIPTGDEALDKYVIGCGGLPGGRMVEVYGPESAGKSSLAASVMANAQRAGGAVALCDAEQAFEHKRAQRVYALDPAAVLHLDPVHQQQGLQMLLDFVKALPTAKPGSPANLAVLDSVPALIPKEELEGEMDDVVMGVRARLYSRWCSAIVKDLARTNTTMLVINQIRMKIGVVFGNPETTPGGNAIKFYSSVRLRLNAGKIKDGALWGSAKAVKNKVGEPGRKAETKLNFKTGYDSAWSILTLSKELGIIPDDSRSVENARVAFDAFASGEPIPTFEKSPKKKKKGKAEEDGEMPFDTSED